VWHFNKPVKIPSTLHASLLSTEVDRDGVKMLLTFRKDSNYFPFLIPFHIERETLQDSLKGVWLLLGRKSVHATPFERY
jgi:hypothetical protein